MGSDYLCVVLSVASVVMALVKVVIKVFMRCLKAVITEAFKKDFKWTEVKTSNRELVL